MGRILVATIGSLGDLHPCMGLAKALSARGHSVRIASCPYHGDYIKQAGIAFVPVRPDLRGDDTELVRQIMNPRWGPEHLHKKHIFPTMRDTLKDLIPLARESDVIIGSVLSYTVPIVSKVTGVPWVSSLLSPMMMWSAHEPPVISALPFLGKSKWIRPRGHRLIFKGFMKLAEPWVRPLSDLRRSHGLPHQNPFLHAHFSPLLTLCHWSPLFGDRQVDWPDSAKATGFIFYDPLQEKPLSSELERFLSEGDPPIVFTLGSTVVASADKFLDLFEKTARRLGKRAVITTGQQNIEKYRPRSDAAILFVDYAPYQRLFPRASLIVHQGGVGTTAQGLRAGKPTLVLPFCMDQLDNAYRIAVRRYGGSLPMARATPGRLAARIQKLLSDRHVIVQAAEVGRLISAEDGPGRAAEALQSAIPKLLPERIC